MLDAMKQTDTILVPLAPGFEEIEAVTIIDVLRRADLSVTVAGLTAGPIRGAHDVTLETDCDLDAVDPARVSMIVLPGGIPGTTHLLEDERILTLVRDLHAAGRKTAAICAAPTVLAKAGVLGAGPATSHPSVRDQLGEARVVASPRVVRAGQVMTSQGVGTALEFALAIVADLCGADRARELGAAMLVPEPA
jgi:4-methyl-5(b-hydroxyethyl)-thiazole monophosphate biosynthesis